MVQLLNWYSFHNTSLFIVFFDMQLENFLVLILQSYIGFCSYEEN